MVAVNYGALIPMHTRRVDLTLRFQHKILVVKSELIACTPS